MTLAQVWIEGGSIERVKRVVAARRYLGRNWPSRSLSIS